MISSSSVQPGGHSRSGPVAFFQPPRLPRIEQPRIIKMVRAVVAPKHDQHRAEARTIIIDGRSAVAHI